MHAYGHPRPRSSVTALGLGHDLEITECASVEASGEARFLETEAVWLQVPPLALGGHPYALGMLGAACSDDAERARVQVSNRPCVLEPDAITPLVPAAVLGRDKEDCLLVDCSLELSTRAPGATAMLVQILVDCLLVALELAATAPAGSAAAALAAAHGVELLGRARNSKRAQANAALIVLGS